MFLGSETTKLTRCGVLFKPLPIRNSKQSKGFNRHYTFRRGAVFISRNADTGASPDRKNRADRRVRGRSAVEVRGPFPGSGARWTRAAGDVDFDAQRRWHGRVLHVSKHHRHSCIGLGDKLPGEQPVGDAPERVKIRPAVDERSRRRRFFEGDRAETETDERPSAMAKRNRRTMCIRLLSVRWKLVTRLRCKGTRAAQASESPGTANRDRGQLN